jgi:ABC-2 type transport system permease protein
MIIHPMLRRLRQDTIRAWVIAEKDIRLYYAKPPILLWGILLPFVLFLSWSIGRNQPTSTLVPGLVAITVFFTASTIGPVIIPWEKTARTFERLLTASLSLTTVLLGKTLAGMIFGVGVALVALLFGSLAFGTHVTNWTLLLICLLLAAGACSALGVLFSTLPRRDVGSVMMLSMLVRWPLLFISGLFVPLSALGIWGQKLAWLSPLTFANDAMHLAMGSPANFAPWLDLGMLALFWCIFLWAGLRLHELGRANNL